MKNIAYITADFLPSSNAISVRSGFFIDRLIEEKNNVVIFTSVKNDKYKIIKNNLNLPTNKDRYLSRLLKEFFYGIELFFRILLHKRMDLYILTSPPFFIIIFTFMAARIKNKKNIILDVRDLYPDVFFENKLLKRTSLLGRVLNKIESYMYKNSIKIITVTEGLKLKIIERETPLHKVTVVKNGFDKNIFQPSNIKYDNFTIVFHGTLGRFQNIEILVKVIEFFNVTDSAVHFLIIGKGSKDSLVKNNSFANLEYVDFVSYKDMPKKISKCHLGVSFRTDDELSKLSLPVKIFEYIGVGIPIVVTPLSEAGKLVEEEKFGIECSNNLENIIKSIQTIRDNYQIYLDCLAKRGKNFSRQHEAKKFNEIIKYITDKGLE